MWQAWFFLFLGFIVMFGLSSILQPKQSIVSPSIIRKKQEKMIFPSNHLSTSLITPENSPYSSRIPSRPSTPIISSYRNSPITYSTLNSPIVLSHSNSRRSLFSHELSDSTSDPCHYGPSTR